MCWCKRFDKYHVCPQTHTQHYVQHYRSPKGHYSLIRFHSNCDVVKKCTVKTQNIIIKVFHKFGTVRILHFMKVFHKIPFFFKGCFLGFWNNLCNIATNNMSIVGAYPRCHTSLLTNIWRLLNFDSKFEACFSVLIDVPHCHRRDLEWNHLKETSSSLNLEDAIVISKI